MKILYLFNNTRAGHLEKIAAGFPDNSFHGLFRLRKYGIETGYAEIEQYLSAGICRFLRAKVLNVYFVHLPILWRLFHYDIVFHISSFPLQFLWAVLGLKKPKWVMYDYSLIGLLGSGKTFKQRILRYIAGRSAGIITISEKEAEMLKSRFPHLKDRIRFVRYGTDLEYFKPRNVPEAEEIFAAGFDRGRDAKTVLEAADGLGIKVVFSNSRHLRKIGPLPSYAEARPLSDSGLLEQYARSKIIIISLDTSGGINDAMGCSTLVEALAMGKAIIATRTPTMESYITDGQNGFLVEEKSAEKMREAIKHLLVDQQLRAEMGAKARISAVKDCDADKIAAQMADFFRSLERSFRRQSAFPKDS